MDNKNALHKRILGFLKNLPLFTFALRFAWEIILYTR